MKIRIGTRKSRLAMIQTEIVKRAIEDKCKDVEIEIIPMSTKGDEILNKSLTAFGGKGVFTKELETALLENKIDMAVHSAKDMPMEFPEGLCIGAVLERANPCDVIITTSGTQLKDLKKGAVVGTSSLRREIQLKKINPDISIKLLRGNVQTRIEKLKKGEYDAIVLAAAGLERLEIEENGICFEYMQPESFIPAAGQGILATEIRKGELKDVIDAIHSEKAAVILKAERTFLRVIGGGCNAPCGAYFKDTEDGLEFHAMYAPDGKTPVIRHEKSKEDPCKAAEKIADELKCKRVSLVGAGPGDKGLITKKALDCIKKAEVIVYDNLISPSILNEASLNAELIYAGKRSSNHHLTQDEINEILVRKAKEGNYVVRLKGGDPFIFGRGGEEALELKKHGIPFEIVPGVSSSYSVPAYAGIPVTERNYASSFHVITGHEGSHKKSEALNYDILAKEEGTLIFLMGLKNLAKITQGLIAGGKDKNTLVAVIEKGTTAHQKKVTGTLDTILSIVEEEHIQTPAITVVGNVVGLEKNLAWAFGGPLAGKRILITGTRNMSSKLSEIISSKGGEPLTISLIETKKIQNDKIEETLKQLTYYNWIVFTSENGVKAFFDTMNELKTDVRALANLKFAVIGSGTKDKLQEYGIYADFVPSKYTSEVFAREWVPSLKTEDKVLLFRAKEANPSVVKELQKRKIEDTDLAGYETMVDVRRKEELNRIITESDYIVFASGSAVKAFDQMIDEDKKNCIKTVSIGPVTSAVLRQAGIRVDLEAEKYTAEGIADAMS